MYKISHMNSLIIAAALLFMGCGPILKSTQGNPYSEQQIPGRIGYYLPKGIIHLQCKPKETGSNNYELSLEIKYVPDFDKFYTIEYCPNSAADDTINVTQENGLLTKIDTTVKDRWVDIVQKLATIPKEIIKATTFPMAKVLRKPTTGQQVMLDIDIDPDLFIYIENETKKETLLDELKNYGLTVKLSSLITREKKINEGPLPYADNGIYYRLPVPYVLTVEFASEEAGTGATAGDSSKPPVPAQPAKPGNDKPTQNPDQTKKEIRYLTRQIFYLPNGGPILSLDVTRAAFVEKKTTITLNNGMLTGFSQTKPSEILAGLDIPLEVIKAIVSLPTDLIQLKINYSKADQAILTQQLEEIKARDALIDYIKQKK